MAAHDDECKDITQRWLIEYFHYTWVKLPLMSGSKSEIIAYSNLNHVFVYLCSGLASLKSVCNELAPFVYKYMHNTYVHILFSTLVSLACRPSAVISCHPLPDHSFISHVDSTDALNSSGNAHTHSNENSNYLTIISVVRMDRLNLLDTRSFILVSCHTHPQISDAV